MQQTTLEAGFARTRPGAAPANADVSRRQKYLARTAPSTYVGERRPR
ncbi:hypothetical protein ACRAWF_15320 [Streptomyces sp. L7]